MIKLSYFENDASIPLYSSDAPNYLVESVVEIIFNAPKNKICSKQPIGATKSCTFVVNLAKLQHRDDIRSDDLGVWKSDGVKSKYCSISFDQNGIVNRVIKLGCKPSVTRNSIYRIKWSYWKHAEDKTFLHRLIEIEGMLFIVIAK